MLKISLLDTLPYIGQPKLEIWILSNFWRKTTNQMLMQKLMVVTLLYIFLVNLDIKMFSMFLSECTERIIRYGIIAAKQHVSTLFVIGT